MRNIIETITMRGSSALRASIAAGIFTQPIKLDISQPPYVEKGLKRKRLLVLMSRRQQMRRELNMAKLEEFPLTSSARKMH